MITIFISYYYCGVETLYLQKCTFSGNEKKKQQHFFFTNNETHFAAKVDIVAL